MSEHHNYQPIRSTKGRQEPSQEEGGRTLVWEPAKGTQQGQLEVGAGPEANQSGVAVGVKLGTPAAAMYDSARGSEAGAVPAAAAYKTRSGRRRRYYYFQPRRSRYCSPRSQKPNLHSRVSSWWPSRALA